MLYLGGKGRDFQKLSYGSESLHMASGGLGEKFESDFADICADKFPLMSMGGRATPSSMR